MLVFLKRSIFQGALILCVCLILGSVTALAQPLDAGEIQITHLEGPQQKGRGYQLVYLVNASLAVYWRFKTDFENDFVVTNKFIQHHRVISQQAQQVVTENEYRFFSDQLFRWHTSIDSDRHRLDFKLLNPEQCRQKFHYGHIQMEAVPQGTKVIQVAYFDFFGAGLWARYPWKGGMKDFLTYTARWEQDTILRLKDHYLKAASPD